MRALTWLALAWACATGVFVALEIQVAPALLIPLMICGAPLLAARGKAYDTILLVSALVMLVFVLLTSFSVGWFYAPSVMLLLAARIRIPPTQSRTS
jgi:hypothetical protein